MTNHPPTPQPPPLTSSSQSNPPTSKPKPTTLIIALSGPSSSGKTTLARLLRQIFNPSSTQSPSPPSSIKTSLFILHQDDFYKTDTLIPRKQFTSPTHGTRDLDDWDCVEALDLPLLKDTLGHVKRNGCLPADMRSKEDMNDVGESGVSEAEVENVRENVQLWLAEMEEKVGQKGRREVVICVLDGFLLYPDPSSKEGSLERELADFIMDSRSSSSSVIAGRLFIPSTRELTITRRAKRTGYVTLEGFWADPPGYVEDVVWPNYKRDHAWLFCGGDGDNGFGEDVDGRVDGGIVNRRVAEGVGILVGPGCGEVGMGDVLGWAVERVREVVERELKE